MQAFWGIVSQSARLVRVSIVTLFLMLVFLGGPAFASDLQMASDPPIERQGIPCPCP